MSKLFILCLLAVLSAHIMTKRHSRRMQSVVQPAAPAPAPATPAPAPAASGSVSGGASAGTSGSTGASGSVNVNVNTSGAANAAANAANAAQSAVDTGVSHTTRAAASAANPAGSSLFTNYAWAQWVFGILYIVIGGPLCIMGLVWWKWNAFPFAGLIGFQVGLAVFDSLAGGNVTETWMWVGMAAAIAFAAALVLVFYFCTHITGGLMGFTLGWMIYTVFLVNYRAISGNTVGWWGLVVFLALAAGGIVFGCCWSKDMILLTSAVYGGWHLIAGIGMLTGQFPQAQPGTEGWVIWCYQIAAIVLMVGGFFFQCNHKARRDKAEGNTTGASGNMEVTVEAEIRV